MNTDPTSLRGMVYAALLGALTAVGAYIIIPLPPVPISSRPFFWVWPPCSSADGWARSARRSMSCSGSSVCPSSPAGRRAGGPSRSDRRLPHRLRRRRLRHRETRRTQDPSRIRLDVPRLTSGMVVIYALGVLQLSLVARLTLLKAPDGRHSPLRPGDAVKIVVTALIARKLQDRLGGNFP